MAKFASSEIVRGHMLWNVGGLEAYFFLIPAAVHHPLTCVCTVGHGRGVEFDPGTRGVPAGPTARQTRTVPVGAQRNPAFRRARRVSDIPVGLQRRPEQHSQQVEQPKSDGQGKWKYPPG